VCECGPEENLKYKGVVKNFIHEKPPNPTLRRIDKILHFGPQNTLVSPVSSPPTFPILKS
jgi:hypothetical protein